MATIEVGPSARMDLAHISAYLRHQAGDRAAGMFEARVGVVLKRLAALPLTGAPRPGLGRDIRSATVEGYVVLHAYDAAADTVFILRVLHGRRRLALDAP